MYHLDSWKTINYKLYYQFDLSLSILSYEPSSWTFLEGEPQNLGANKVDDIHSPPTSRDRCDAS